MDKPLIAIAIGDPAGIGPEIALKAATADVVVSHCRPILVGDRAVLAFYADQLGLPLRLQPIEVPEDAGGEADVIGVIEPGVIHTAALFEPGKSDRLCGRAVLAYAKCALDLAQRGAVHAVVAGPHTQASVVAVDSAFDGYPGLVARHTGTDPDRVFVMLITGRLRIAHVTLHLGLRDALGKITRARVLAALRASHQALGTLGLTRRRIGVAGINPHGGENGLYGTEEAEIIAPAINDARAEGIDVHGPFGADTMYLDTGFDGYLVMYHDQGHVPAKLIGFDSISAFTIGTPVLFSSVGHGSALDIAGTGRANPNPLICTILRVAGEPELADRQIGS